MPKEKKEKKIPTDQWPLSGKNPATEKRKGKKKEQKEQEEQRITIIHINEVYRLFIHAHETNMGEFTGVLSGTSSEFDLPESMQQYVSGCKTFATVHGGHIFYQGDDEAGQPTHGPDTYQSPIPEQWSIHVSPIGCTLGLNFIQSLILFSLIYDMGWPAIMASKLSFGENIRSRRPHPTFDPRRDAYIGDNIEKTYSIQNFKKDSFGMNKIYEYENEPIIDSLRPDNILKYIPKRELGNERLQMGFYFETPYIHLIQEEVFNEHILPYVTLLKSIIGGSYDISTEFNLFKVNIYKKTIGEVTYIILLYYRGCNLMQCPYFIAYNIGILCTKYFNEIYLQKNPSHNTTEIFLSVCQQYIEQYIKNERVRLLIRTLTLEGIHKHTILYNSEKKQGTKSSEKQQIFPLDSPSIKNITPIMINPDNDIFKSGPQLGPDIYDSITRKLAVAEENLHFDNKAIVVEQVVPEETCSSTNSIRRTSTIQSRAENEYSIARHDVIDFIHISDNVSNDEYYVITIKKTSMNVISNFLALNSHLTTYLNTAINCSSLSITRNVINAFIPTPADIPPIKLAKDLLDLIGRGKKTLKKKKRKYKKKHPTKKKRKEI